jgi:REP element-mobilizing transposase RayT
LEGYDYSSPGLYFITLCVQNRERRFGEVENFEMNLNSAGKMVDRWWNKIPEKFPNARLDVYQIMPNHFHAIVRIVRPRWVKKDISGVDPRVNPGKFNFNGWGGHVGPQQEAPRQWLQRPRPPHLPYYEPRFAYIPGIVQWFKTMTTNKYIQGVKAGHYPQFDRRLWQRNYYDDIIWDNRSLRIVRQYIADNPAQWKKDRNNPQNFND